MMYTQKCDQSKFDQGIEFLPKILISNSVKV